MINWNSKRTTKEGLVIDVVAHLVLKDGTKTQTMIKGKYFVDGGFWSFPTLKDAKKMFETSRFIDINQDLTINTDLIESIKFEEIPRKVTYEIVNMGIKDMDAIELGMLFLISLVILSVIGIIFCSFWIK